MLPEIRKKLGFNNPKHDKWAKRGYVIPKKPIEDFEKLSDGELKEPKPICKRCGDCCRTKTLLRDSGWKVRIMRFLILLFNNPKMLFRKPNCPYLSFENGLAKCLQYDKRPQFCKDYYCQKCYEKD